jgi:hypothetical protein
MKETYYFPHDYNARCDRKLVNVIMKHGMEGIGVFWCLVEMLYEEGGYMPLEFDRITFELRTDIKIVQSIIKEFDLFENDGSKFWSESVLSRLQKRADKSEKARKSIQSRWEKFKRNTDVLGTNKGRNTIKEKKKKEIKEKKGSIPFKLFWDTYDKKIDWERCESTWGELTNAEREACMAKIPAYILSNPDKKFRLNPVKYLIQKAWLNEIVLSDGKNGSNIRGEIQRINDLWNTQN